MIHRALISPLTADIAAGCPTPKFPTNALRSQERLNTAMIKCLDLRTDILVFNAMLIVLLAWVGVYAWFSLVHDRLPHGTGELLNWLFGWGHG